VAAPLPILRTVMDGLRARILHNPFAKQIQDRASQWLERARNGGPPNDWLDSARASELVTKLRDAPWPPGVERVGSQVQRLGERAFSRMLSRWPALSELVAPPAKAARKRKKPSAKAAATAPAAPNGVLDETALEVLVVQLVAAPNWQSRAGAAAALAQLDGDGVREALNHALRDPSVEVAISAVDALARRGDRSAQEALRGVLDNVDGYFSPVTRVAALSALGRMVSDNELGQIMAYVRDLDAEVSIAAIAVIADRKRATAAEQLLPILQDGSGYFLPIVRLAAANAMTRAGALTPELAQQLLDREQASAVRRVLERVAQCPPM
jgi:HEAT repeats